MIRIRILGSAAGGGLPQWNCRCPNCDAARSGKIPSQTQSSIAFTTDDEHWWLVNASPDLPQQIERNPELQPRDHSLRNSPIAGIFLTNPDIDHVLGLVSMRQEALPLVVYATNETKNKLLWIDNLIAPFRPIQWQMIDSKLDGLNPSSLRLSVEIISLRVSIAFRLRDESSARAALIAPAIAQMTDELREAAGNSEAVFFDGTFWSDDELGKVRGGARTAGEMNHVTISESLPFLRDCGAKRKIYTHINNTNPILSPGSAERKEVEDAGIEVGYDGLEVVL